MAAKSTRKNVTTPAVDDELVELLGEAGAQAWEANPGDLTAEADEHLTEVLAQDAQVEAAEAQLSDELRVAIAAGEFADELTDPQEEAEAILEEVALEELPVADVEDEAPAAEAEVVAEEESPAEPVVTYEVVASNCYEQLISLVGKGSDPEVPLVVEGTDALEAALALKTGWFITAAGADERHRIVGFTVRGDGGTVAYRRTKDGVERVALEAVAA